MLNNDWDAFLAPVFQEDWFKELTHRVKQAYQDGPCYPPIHSVFHALRLTSYQATKVVILGQDPYHQQGQAMGLSFSVPPGVAFPPSLENILKELNADLGVAKPASGDLTRWANQGVLLLNAVLSVEESNPTSHAGFGWQTFTDRLLTLLNQKPTPVVFVLWGSFARSKKLLLTNPIHLILESAHPSPLSAYRGFFGSKPFSKTNEFLIQAGLPPIDWDLNPQGDA
jgi:uracil-DNA glycosylase